MPLPTHAGKGNQITYTIHFPGYMMYYHQQVYDQRIIETALPLFQCVYIKEFCNSTLSHSLKQKQIWFRKNKEHEQK